MRRNHQASPWVGVTSGTIAAILANVITYPLDMYVFPPTPLSIIALNNISVKTRLQVQVQRRKQRIPDEGGNPPPAASATQYDNLVDAIVQSVRDEGISGLYNGLSSSILGTAFMNFAYFYWSTGARNLYYTVLPVYKFPDSNSILKELSLGAVGGTMAQLCTTPVAVAIMQQQSPRPTDERKSMQYAVLGAISKVAATITTHP